MPPPLPPLPLPDGIRSRTVAGVNGLQVHLLEAGGGGDRPLILLLHGFPELAFSWRRVMPLLAAAGYHVVAPDARGYGRTTGGATGYDIDLSEYGLLNLVRDVLGTVAALGQSEVALVAGHDSGASTAAACALARPDVFRRVALMSAPFAGAPALPAGPPPDPSAALAALDPPRQHYHWYYATRSASGDMERCPEGLPAFLRAYFHQKSADWPGNRPHRLPDGSAASMAVLPSYYVMPLGTTMPEAVRPHMPPAEAAWLTDAELAVYAAEYGRTGFGGGLNWYRLRIGGQTARDLSLFSGRRIDIPSLFVAGSADWGIHQTAGALDAMRDTVCTDLRDCVFVPGAGHWVQQEQPEATGHALLTLLES